MKWFKAILKILGILVLIGFIGIAYLFYRTGSFTHPTTEQVKTQAGEYVSPAVAAIVHDWDIAELKKRAHPRLLKELETPQAEADFKKILSEVGPLKSAVSCYIDDIKFFGPTLRGDPGYTQVTYNCYGEYEKSNVVFKAIIVQNTIDSPWQFVGFRVDSP